MAYTTYTEKLQDVRWQKLRLKIFERDNWTCQASDCRSKEKTLHVHHTEYFNGKEPWDYPPDMLITLCDDCHKKENDREQLEKYLAQTFKMKGFLVSDLLAMSVKLNVDEEFSQSLLNTIRKFQDG